MRTSSLRPYCQLVLLALLLLSSLAPGMAIATPPEPTPASGVEEPPLQDADYDAVPAVDKSARGPRSEASLPSAEASTTPSDQPSSEDSSDDATEENPDESAPQMPAESPAAAAVSPTGFQGMVTLNVEAPDTIHPGDPIVYTYMYRNGGSTTATGLVLNATWSNLIAAAGIPAWQSCDPAPCAASDVQGPPVSPIGAISSGWSFGIGNLAPGETGSFSVQLLSSRGIFPKTGQQPSRPAGSGSLRWSGMTTAPSEDTFSTLVIGPAIELTKRTDATRKYYPLEPVDFIIRVGNATGAGDTVGGQLRADARPATNLVVKDTFPQGAEFVSATGDPVVDTTAKTVTWTILGPLNPGAQPAEFRVTYRKANLNVDCTRLNNAIYEVKYEDPAEAPVAGALYRYKVPVSSSTPAVASIVVPLAIKSITATPAVAPFSSEGTLTIVVQNYWDRPLSGVQLHYDIQPNAYYITSSAGPAPSAAPDGSQPGGRVTWTFDTPAASKTAPSELTFTLRLRAGFTTAGAGRAHIEPRADVPTACSQLNGQMSVQPRLKLTKGTTADPSTKLGDTFIVDRGQEFAYYVEVTNSGAQAATNVSIADAFPRETGANFSYVDGSATLPPLAVTNGLGGSLIWNNLTIPAGGMIRLDYRLVVDGRDYYKYCNSATVSMEQGEQTTLGTRQVCVKINPRIEVKKTADRACANPGEEVRFTLTLTNNESTTYRVGLYDDLSGGTQRVLEYVGQESGYAQPVQFANPATGRVEELEWPLVDLAPGESRNVVIVTRIPRSATPGDFVNEVLFHNETDIIQRIPRMTAKVHAPCIEYNKTVDRATVSLRDRMTFTLQLRSYADVPLPNVAVVDLLPQGFAYVGPDPTSNVTTAPAQQPLSDGRTRLTWTLPAIAPLATINLKYAARSGDIVGTFDNLVTVPGGMCVAPAINGRGCRPEAGIIYAFQAVTVQAWLTVEPKILETGCARPGNPGDSRTYQVSLLNTNTRDYSGVQVKAVLAYGLRYDEPLPGTAAPDVSSDEEGRTVLTWRNLRIPAKPAASFAAQVALQVRLEVGQVFGDLDTTLEAITPDGLIPRKDDAVNPTVPVCVGSPTLAKDASERIIKPGDEVVYQITLANPTANAQTAAVEDQLPAAFSFIESVAGLGPMVSGNTLTWTDVTVPAAANGKPGTVALRFKTRATSGVVGQSYTNTARITTSSVPFDATHSSVSVLVANEVHKVFLPLVRR